MIEIRNTAPVITVTDILLVALPKLKRPRINRPIHK
jgi:hypothetical protein